MAYGRLKEHGMAKVEKYYGDYGIRAKELNKQGRSVIAYLCSLVPVEIIEAAGCVPLRIKGDVHEPISKGDSQLETIACPFVRSCFDTALKGRYDFCSGLIIPHACDSIARTYSVWRYSLGLPYSHFINHPHTINRRSMEFFKAELDTFRKSIGRFAGKDVSDQDLCDYVIRYNENRDKVRELYELRKSDPPRISGAEITRTLVAGMGIPVEESNALFNEVLREARERKDYKPGKLPRIMVVGASVDNTDFIGLIEDCGANVVVDNTCIGTRDYWPKTDITDDPMEGIAIRYLDKINCPRTDRENSGRTYEEGLENRFGDIGSLIEEFHVDGVILYIYKYCDPFGFEIPARQAYLKHLKMPTLYIEDQYSAGTIARLRTRVQAFLEMIA